jgi:anti-sigma factor RsiW
MAFEFYPPQVMEAWPLKDSLLKRVVSPRGVAVLITGSSIVLSRAVTQDDTDAADYAYLGGRTHNVSNAEAAMLTSLGFPTKTRSEAIALSDVAHTGFLVDI